MRLITNQNSTYAEFNSKLRFQAEPVARITDRLREVALDLVAGMYRMNAVGLAANQVGLKISVCALDPAWLYGKKLPIVMFNPEIVEHGEEIYTSPEGCLSLPDVGVHVGRFRNVKVRFLGLDGKEYTISDDNSLLSSVLQHEVDHLNGNLCIDRLPEPFKLAYKDSIVLGG